MPKTALKLSDTFGKFLFNKSGDNSNTHHLTWSDTDFLYKVIEASEKEYSSQLFHKTKKDVMLVEKDKIDIISKFGVVDGSIYGVLNEDGPHLHLEWKADKPRDSSVEIAKIFMTNMKKYNTMVADISNMNAAKNILSRPMRSESHRRNTRVHPAPASGGRRRSSRNQTRRQRRPEKY